jgi:hypothetical protein
LQAAHGGTSTIDAKTDVNQQFVSRRSTAMNKRKISAFILVSSSFVLIGILAYLFFWGPLFPFSPFIPGFTKHECPHVIIYIQNSSDFVDIARIDTLIPVVEKFHDLHFVKKPEIFIFGDSSGYLQRSPSRARIFAYYDGTIVVSPWLIREDRDRFLSLSIYVQHELSHSILYQNMGLYRAFRSPQWFIEGLAVYSSNQLGTSFYPGKAETYDLIRRGNYLPPQYFKTSKEDEIALNVPYRVTFMYSEFGCIVDYLVATGGRDKFLVYMKSLLKNSEHDAAFKAAYGIDFDRCLIDFREYVKSYDVRHIDPHPASKR